MRRLLWSLVLAFLCGGVLTTRTYTEFERVRLRVVKEPLAPDTPQLEVVLPDLAALGGQPSALILNLRGATEATVSVSLGAIAIGDVSLEAGRDTRVDLTFSPPAGPMPALMLSSSASGWSARSVEIANIHGQSRGLADLVIVPSGRTHHPAVPSWLFVVVVPLLLTLMPRWHWPSNRWRYLYRAVVISAAGALLLSLISPLVTRYKLLLSFETVILLAAFVYSERIARAGVFLLGPVVRPVVHRFRPDARLEKDVPALPAFRELAWAVAAFSALTLVLLFPQVREIGSVPDLGDPLFSMWRMGWIDHQSRSDPRHLFDANIFYPLRGTLTFSDAMLLPALPNAMLVSLGVHPVVAYNLLFLSAFVFAATATYVLARSFAYGVPAAWTSGVVFGFYSFRFEHYSHLELQFSGWMPLVLLGVYRLVMGRGGGGAVAVTTLSLAAQWYSSMYFGLYLSVYAASFAGVLLLTQPRDKRRILPVAGSIALGVLLALPLAAAYRVFADQRGERPENVVTSFSATAGDYLQSTERRAIYRWMRWGEPQPERQLFPGVAPLALGVAGAIPPMSATRLAVVVAGLVGFDGSLGFNGLWYPVAYELLFPFRSIRVPARFAMLVGLSLALLAGAAVQRWGGNQTPRARALTIVPLTLLLCVDAWPKLTLVPVWRDAPPIYAPLTYTPGAVLLEYPLNPVPEAFGQNIPSMYFSMRHWRPMINGYSGHLPDKYAEIVSMLDGFPNVETVERARALGVTHISVICGIDGTFAALGVPVPNREKCASAIGALDDLKSVRPLVRSQWNGEPALLYEIRR